jgi:hypothetical protein
VTHHFYHRFLFGVLIPWIPLIANAQVPANQDTIVIPGGTLAGRENTGALETTINGDTLSTGERVNPNRVYALNEGQYYYQAAPINVYNPTGNLIIAGIPSTYGKTKPIILIGNSCKMHVVVNRNGTNSVIGSLILENIYYVTKEEDGYQNNELFYCGTANKHLQSLRINNCLFEFCRIDLFDCSDEPGAIGGWPYGAKFRITNSYFRNMFNPERRWGARIFQCTHPIDTLWVENCTVTTGGIAFFQKNQLTEFAYINHNTFVNNSGTLLGSPYHHRLFITQNIFMNQNWVGEDSLVRVSGQDPDNQFTSTINVDTNNATNGLVVQGKYYAGDSSHYSPLLALNKLQVYISDNINFYSPSLISGYYNSNKYLLSSLHALPSYLTWSFSAAPFPIENVPGSWMNSRTLALFAAYGPGNGGFLEMRTSTANPGTLTPGIADSSVVDFMAEWNQHEWGDPRFPFSPPVCRTRFIFGDYDARTLPGIDNGVKTDAMTSAAAGIAKFTDLTENFSQSAQISTIDGLPIGALIWDDSKLAAYSSGIDWSLVNARYRAWMGMPLSSTMEKNLVPPLYSLAQNYPNPFNPSTMIRYGIPERSQVLLSVYNTIGQQVGVLAQGEEEAGYHEVKFDASALASGVYFYRLQAGGYVDTKKLLLLR